MGKPVYSDETSLPISIQAHERHLIQLTELFPLRLTDVVNLADLLIPLAAKMAEEPFKLLIMDSITSNLRVDFSGRGELADRQQKLGQMMARLRKVGSQALLIVLNSARPLERV